MRIDCRLFPNKKKKKRKRQQCANCFIWRSKQFDFYSFAGYILDKIIFEGFGDTFPKNETSTRNDIICKL